MSALSTCWSYLCRRAGERTTWLGLAIVTAAVLVCIFLRREIFAEISAAAASAIMAAPDRLLRSTLRNFFLPPSHVPVAGQATPEPEGPITTRSVPMSIVSSIVSAAIKEAENTTFNAVVTSLGASDLAPEAKQFVTDFATARANPSLTNDLRVVADGAQLIHDLTTQVATLQAAAAAGPASPPPPPAE